MSRTWPDGNPVTPWADPWHDVMADIREAWDDAGEPARSMLSYDWRGHMNRREQLIAAYGQPESIDPADALALARASIVRVDPTVTADDVYACIYRDEGAADGWLQSNLVNHGHPALAKVPLPDGRVIGILDLRPALKRIRGGT